MENSFQNIIDKFEQYTIEEVPSMKNKLKSEILEKLNNLGKLESNHYHIWGLVYYFSGDKPLEKELIKAIYQFEKALKINKDNFLSQLYISHCYHDLNDYKKALSNYLLVDKNKLKEFQYWRYLKLLEQIGLCYFKLEQKNIALNYFKEVLENYKNHIKPITLPHPSELLECLDEENWISKEIRLIIENGNKFI